MSEQEVDVRQIRIISPEPVLAEILAAHKPIFISEIGWKWIVSWIADIGTIIRSREFIAYNIASMLAYVATELVFASCRKLFFAEKFSILNRLKGRC